MYIPVDIESQPWSNNSPNGVDVPVLLACLPSIASKLWYINKPSAHRKHAHLGAYKIMQYQYQFFNCYIYHEKL